MPVSNALDKNIIIKRFTRIKRFFRREKNFDQKSEVGSREFPLQTLVGEI